MFQLIQQECHELTFELTFFYLYLTTVVQFYVFLDLSLKQVKMVWLHSCKQLYKKVCVPKQKVNMTVHIGYTLPSCTDFTDI